MTGNDIKAERTVTPNRKQLPKQASAVKLMKGKKSHNTEITLWLQTGEM
jgi:hypothetical protein